MSYLNDLEQLSKRETISSADILRCVGVSPDFKNIALDSQDYSKRYAEGLNWANYALSQEELKTHSLEYAKAQYDVELVDLLEKAKTNLFLNVGKICYLANSGCKLQQSSISRIKENFNKIAKLTLEEDAKADNNEDIELKVSKKDIKAKRNYNKLSELIGIVDQVIDEFIVDEKEPDIYNMFIKAKCESYIVKDCDLYYKQKYVEVLDEIKNVKLDASLNDEERNNYINDLNKYLIALDHVRPGLSCYLGNNKANTSPKSSKSKKALNEVAKAAQTIKFKTHDINFKVQSITLDRVINSQMLIAFNTKTRKISLYYAKDEKGLQVKGTTLLNFDELKSVQKMLRKPEDYLHHFQQNSDYRAIIVFNNLSTQKGQCNGRLNEHTILLKAFKKLTIVK